MIGRPGPPVYRPHQHIDRHGIPFAASPGNTMSHYSGWMPPPQGTDDLYAGGPLRPLPASMAVTQHYMPHNSYLEPRLAPDPMAYLHTMQQLSLRTAMHQGVDPSPMAPHAPYTPNDYQPYISSLNAAGGAPAFHPQQPHHHHHHHAHQHPRAPRQPPPPPPQHAAATHRFVVHPPPGIGAGQKSSDTGRLHFVRHERVPLVPRGPPLKPKQSGFALWAGNLPNRTSIYDLKDHFARDATDAIESVFLMAKSSCAFVNYKTREARDAAIRRFNGSQFGGGRLVCRVRKDTDRTKTTTATAVMAGAPTQLPTPPREPSASPEEHSPSNASGSPTELFSADNDAPGATSQVDSNTPAKHIDGAAPALKEKSGNRYFIVKSLTQGDVEASVRQGTWETQQHNEGLFNHAYHTASNVYLIFSVNKSGEYFGCARMASAIFDRSDAVEPLIPQHAQDPDQPSLPVKKSQGFLGTLQGHDDSDGNPKIIPTSATETAPRGYVVDDSARGTLFWEVDVDATSAEEDDDSGTPRNGSTDSAATMTTASTATSTDSPPSVPSAAAAKRFGRASHARLFQIEWLSLRAIPFGQTRGMKNAWNEHREVKVAKDGTELETDVGARLLALFRPGGSQQ